MALTFSQLIVPLTPAQMVAQLLSVLQGVSQVSQVGSGSGPIVGTGAVTISGNAQAAAQVVVKIIASGQAGTATYQVSFDGGVTFSGTVTTPATGIPISLGTTGCTIAFTNGLYAPTAGSFILGEQYQFNTSVPNFQVTNWTTGSAPMTLLQLEATSLSDLNQLISNIAAGGFPYSWITPPPNGPPPSGFLDLLAQWQYNVPAATGGTGRNLAVQTQGQLTLTNTSGTPQTVLIGQLLFASAVTGKLYSNTTGGTVGANSTLTIQAIAQVAGAAGNVPSNTGAGGDIITVLQTPIAGVSVNNPLNATPPVGHAGPGTGTLTAASTATSEIGVSVLISAAGAIGVATFQYSTNGGQTYSAPQTLVAGPNTIGSTNTTITPAGTFTLDDVYSYSTAWRSVNGSDQESDLSLATRCTNQWASLAAAGPTAIYSNWAKAASTEVVNVQVIADPIVPGQVDVVVSGPGGSAVSAGAITAITNYINARLPEAIKVAVQSAQQLNITVSVSGTGSGIFVYAAQLASAQSAVATALQALASATPLGGIIYYDKVITAIQNQSGVRNIEGLTVNGGAVDIQLAPATGALFLPISGAAFVAV